MFRHSLLDVIPEFLESCFVIPLGARAAHGHGLLSPRNRVPEATSLRPTPSHHPGPGANRSSGRALRSWPARADLKPHSSDSPSVMKFEKRRVASIKESYRYRYPIIVPWYPDTVSVGMCCARSDRRLPFGLSPAVRHIHAHVQTMRTGWGGRVVA